MGNMRCEEECNDSLDTDHGEITKRGRRIEELEGWPDVERPSQDPSPF